MRAQYTSVAASWTRWLMPQVWKQAHQRHARTYKRTLPKIKLCSRTEALVSREAEVSLLALQIVLAEAAQRQRRAGVTMIVLGSARQELLRIRGAITTTIGAKLGPWQRALVRAPLGPRTSGRRRAEGQTSMASAQKSSRTQASENLGAAHT